MSSEEDNKLLAKLLKNLQLSGRVGTQKGNGADTIYGSGRVGYNIPLEDSNLNAGLGIGGYKTKVDVPGYKNTFKDFGVNNIDAQYTNGYSQYYPKGQNTIGGNYQINPQGKDGLNLYYKRNF